MKGRGILVLIRLCGKRRHRNNFTRFISSCFYLCIQVSINNIDVQICRGMDRTAHKPLYLKKFCREGRNQIDITVAACCCVSYIYLLNIIYSSTFLALLIPSASPHNATGTKNYKMPRPYTGGNAGFEIRVRYL